MPEITKHPHGTFCWSDLGTPDPTAAKAFYEGLFGWTHQDDPMGETETYTRFLKDGRDVCALYPQRPEMKGMPPFWGAYLSVDDVDAMAAKVAGLGGKLAMPPFDVFDAGRMCAVQDPTGAACFLWQAKKHIGARVMREPGSLTWAEVMTTNVDVAGGFYTRLLGWRAEASPQMPYTLFMAPGQTEPAAGMMALKAEMKGVPPHWLIHFEVAHCDASVKKAESLGGRTLFPPTDIPQVGRFAVLQDPQGATFGVFQSAR